MKKERKPNFLSVTVYFSDGVLMAQECADNDAALLFVESMRLLADRDRDNHGATYTVTDYRIVPVYAV